MRIDLTKYVTKLGLVSETAKQLTEISNGKPASLEAMTVRMAKVKSPIKDGIPNRLNKLEEKLQASLSSTLKFQEETDSLMRWLNKMNIALKGQSPLSADESVVKRQIAEHKYLADDVTRYINIVLKHIEV